MREWSERRRIRNEFIQPGKPQQNASVERPDRTVRYDWRAQQLFESIEAVPEQATRWLWTYDGNRPDMAIGGITAIRQPAMVA